MNKFSKFCHELSSFSDIKPSIFLSPASGYRARCEFGISNSSYTMIEDGKKIFMEVSRIPHHSICLLYTSPSPRDKRQSRMPSSA